MGKYSVDSISLGKQNIKASVYAKTRVESTESATYLALTAEYYESDVLVTLCVWDPPFSFISAMCQIV